MKAISNLQYITTSAALAEQACMSGVNWIQLRLKDVSYDEYKAVALEVQAVCKQYNATFIINDNVKLALDIHSDGVHVGKGDPLLMEDIEELLTRGCIIGCTANTVDDFIHLAGKQVSYIGLGPFRFTTTKQNLSPILGMEGYKKIFARLKEQGIPHAPVIGIGGITENDVVALIATGIDGIAVSGAISNAKNIPVVVQKFKNLLHKTDSIVNKTITINAPAAKIWEAITNPKLLKKWWTDNGDIDIATDWKAGSTIMFKGKLHGINYDDKGYVLQFEPEKVLRYSYWSKISRLPDSPENYMVIEFRMVAKDDETTLSLTQSNFQLETIYKHWNYYWTLTLDRMKKLIEQGKITRNE